MFGSSRHARCGQNLTIRDGEFLPKAVRPGESSAENNELPLTQGRTNENRAKGSVAARMGANLIPPEILKPVRRQRCIDGRAGNRPPPLVCAGVVAFGRGHIRTRGAACAGAPSIRDPTVTAARGLTLAVLSALSTLVAIEIVHVNYLQIGFEATGVLGFSFLFSRLRRFGSCNT
jgi:hypothetical protein